MAKRLIILFSVLFSVMLASTTAIAAQTSEPDVAAISKSVLSANPQTLIQGLQTPMSNSALPKDFSDAKFHNIEGKATPTEATPTGATPVSGSTASDCLYDASGLKGTEGAVGYSVVGDTAAIGVPYVCASINYVVFNEKALGSHPLADFKSGIQEGLQSSAGEGTPDAQGGIAKVVDVKVAGEDAVLLTYTLKSQRTSVVVQTLALPVGNVFVISLVTLGDVTKVDSGAAETYANELTVAAIEHLGTVAKGAQ